MEKYYTKKLKIILHSKIFWGLWIVFIFLYTFIFLQQPFLEAKEEAISFEGKIVEYIWDFQSKKIKLTLKKGSKKELIFYNYQEGEEETLKEVIQYGSLIKGNGKKIIPSKNTIPNTFNYQKYLKSIGYDYYIVSNKIECFKSGSIHEKIHESFRDYLEKKKESVYYKTLLLGIKENWSKKREQIFRENGISHLFVISGLHLGFLFGIVQQILKKFFRIKKIPILCSFFFLSLYYSFLTKSVSSERAYGFFFLLTLNELTNLNLKSKQIYLLNIGMQLLKNPFLFFNIGFQYSVCLSFTFLFFPLKEKSKWKRILKNSFLAFFVSFPITLNQSFMINPWSILINLIMIPFLSGILFPVLLFSFVIPYFLNGVSFLFTIMEWCNDLFYQLPFSHINVAKMPNYLFWSYYFCFFLTIYLKQKKILFFWFFLWSIFLFAPKFDSTGYFYFIDVGQGDCTLIISPYQKEVLLVDTGNESESLKNNLILFLKSLGIQKINYLILTHGDKDHTGNALEILKEIKVEKILLNQGEKNEIERIIMNKYPEKIVDFIETKFLKITLLSHQIRKNENDNSILFHGCIYQTCALFLADATTLVEEEIVNQYHMKAMILKVAHHGSKTSTSEILLNQIAFQYGIISVGENNLYAMPHSVVLERLKKYHINILETKVLGTIGFKIRKKRYTILSFPP